MKFLKRIITALMAVFICLSILPAACAETDSSVFEGKSWEEVIDAFLAEHDTETSGVGLGYYNTVTGEEHYYNKEDYFITASMFKIPINMLFLDKLSAGEIDWDTNINGYQYKNCLELTIVDSRNDIAELMWKYVGGYRTYRELICPYMGVDAETVDQMYWKNNYFTPEQMICCLKQLYEGSDRYESLIDKLKAAEPDNYFNYHKQDYTIAHKYGYFTEGYNLILNDCAICYTDDPIVIVAFTYGINKPYEFLADFCTLMCDYAQYHTAERREQEQAEQEAAAIAALEGGSSSTEGDSTTSSAEIIEGYSPVEEGDSNLRSSVSIADVIRIALVAITALSGVIALIYSVLICREKKLNLPWAIGAIIVTVAGLLFCVYSPDLGSITVKTEGNPQETVTRFFDGVISADFDTAYACLDDYSDLGLGNVPELEAGQLIYSAFRDSLSYKLHSGCSVDGVNATQQVILRHLDINALNADLQTESEAQLERLVERRAAKDIYDENNNYFPEVTQEAYLNAVNALLEHAEDYYTTTGIEVKLLYTGGEWKILTDQPLLSALSGGTV